jgi:hypothetical protein
VGRGLFSTGSSSNSWQVVVMVCVGLQQAASAAASRQHSWWLQQAWEQQHWSTHVVVCVCLCWQASPAPVAWCPRGGVCLPPWPAAVCAALLALAG